jgi:ATP-binding protein involved in chromosome partitioning
MGLGEAAWPHPRFARPPRQAGRSTVRLVAGPGGGTARRHVSPRSILAPVTCLAMAAPSPDQVLGVLAHIQDPDLGRDVVSLGMIKELEVSPEGKVSFTFELTTPACPVRDRFKSQAQDLVGDIPGVTAVDVRMTANVRPAFMRPKPSEILPGVKQTIAVASGKGGVGKSTVAVNLAAALRKAGAEVGLLDADIYGPSVPAMIGSKAVPEQLNGRLQPVDAHGLKVMSFGLIYPGEQPTIYRGPMVGKAIEAMMVQVDWGMLDYLVIDLPPGTGDASLTLAQAIPLTGVAIVCTPQDVATDIAVKALQMFRKLNVTPLGLIENMSWYICPSCGHRHEIFSHGGAEAAAKRLGVPFLGAIPLEEGIREDADSGTPVVISRPDSVGAQAFVNIASQVAARTSIQSFRQLPVINVR